MVGVEHVQVDQLIQAFLAELLYRFLTSRTLFVRFSGLRIVEGALTARGPAVEIDPSRHPIRTELKAVTYHGLDGTGSVYADAATLMLEEPVVTASAGGGQVQLSFPTLYGPQYQVYYKTNITEASWHALGSPVVGDGTVKTVSDPAGATSRFYTVNTL